ncbi:hypothetical protein AMECASPLE_035940, partial [Ameca splendens]
KAGQISRSRRTQEHHRNVQELYWQQNKNITGRSDEEQRQPVDKVVKPRHSPLRKSHSVPSPDGT